MTPHHPAYPPDHRLNRIIAAILADGAPWASFFKRAEGLRSNGKRKTGVIFRHHGGGRSRLSYWQFNAIREFFEGETV